MHKRPITSFVHGEGRRFSTAGTPNYGSLIDVSQVLHDTDGSLFFFFKVQKVHCVSSCFHHIYLQPQGLTAHP